MALIRISWTSGAFEPLTFTTWESDGIKRAFMVAVENKDQAIRIHTSETEGNPHWRDMSLDTLANRVTELDMIEVYCWFDNALQFAVRANNDDRVKRYIPRWESAMEYIAKRTA